MTNIQHPAEKKPDGTSVFAAIVKTITLLATGAWALTVLAFMSAFSGPGWNALGLLIVLIFATPPFVIFVLPALLFSFLGGEAGAKAGACLLATGVVVFGFVVGGPLLRTMF